VASLSGDKTGLLEFLLVLGVGSFAKGKMVGTNPESDGFFPLMPEMYIKRIF
jgi:hypothetical protein